MSIHPTCLNEIFNSYFCRQRAEGGEHYWLFAHTAQEIHCQCEPRDTDIRCRQTSHAYIVCFRSKLLPARTKMPLRANVRIYPCRRSTSSARSTKKRHAREEGTYQSVNLRPGRVASSPYRNLAKQMWLGSEDNGDRSMRLPLERRFWKSVGLKKRWAYLFTKSSISCR